MSYKNANIGIVILAAGDGTRMKSPTPKVMSPLHGRPLVSHVVGNVEESGCCDKPVVVVCKNHTLVQDHLGDRAAYVVQEKQLGTGHATATAQPLLEGNVDHVIVLYGDMPFLKGDSIQRLIDRHVERENVVTLMTTTVPHFEGEYAGFYSFGRIIRRESDGHIAKIVEKKDSNEDELLVRELNTSYFCFNAAWLWEHVNQIQNNNTQGEYYLTDLLQIAIDEGQKISSIDIDPKEAMGVNTLEDLEAAQGV